MHSGASPACIGIDTTMCFDGHTYFDLLLNVCRDVYSDLLYVQVKEILQEEEDLSEIVQLVGKVCCLTAAQ